MINPDGGIAINDAGQVAFHGWTAGRVGTVFTNDGTVAAEGDTLPDGSTIRTIISDLIIPRGIAINDAGQVAFHGDTAPGAGTVFTNDGTVAANGDTLPDGSTIVGIYFWGGIAINDAGQVAFQVTSNDRRTLIVRADPVLDPLEQIGAILEFFDTAVEEGSLVGSGPAASAAGRLGALRNMLEAAETLIAAGATADACVQLQDALDRTDGERLPPDFVAGEASSQLASLIRALMETLGCG
jgi:hypothetical protein